MKHLRHLLCLCAMLALICAGCSDDEPANPGVEEDYDEPPMATEAHAAKSIELNASQQAINVGMRNFSWDLFSTISEQKAGDTNLIFSPLSLEVELAMLLNSADESSLRKVLPAMHLSDYSVTEINQYFNHFATGIAEADNVTRFSSSNSLWYDMRYTVVPQIQQVLEEYYACEFFPVVYGEETTAKINRWAEERTYGRIKNVLEKPPTE